MPYVQEADKLYLQRAGLLEVVQAIKDYPQEDREGVVNYTISTIVAETMKPETGWRYKWLNRAYGTFHSAATEFYRRLVAPYEDNCIEKNGDISSYEK